ncbi:hypothetical protein GCM10010472_54660 [Pseudonocardia halophobica]|uniref:Uncharacterized protein n=1 Tax=Pseudonocardia halophobica TaxID=29401 RepID=A0A9W6L5Q2_9PSEU|nr:hypothetical protein GCM10017577_26850 [Pseudonocardia halophobica]
MLGRCATVAAGTGGGAILSIPGSKGSDAVTGGNGPSRRPDRDARKSDANRCVTGDAAGGME